MTRRTALLLGLVVVGSLFGGRAFAEEYRRGKKVLQAIANRHHAVSVSQMWPNQDLYARGNPQLAGKLHEDGGANFRALGPGDASAMLREIGKIPGVVIMATANHGGGAHGMVGAHRDGDVFLVDGIDPNIPRTFKNGDKIRRRHIGETDDKINMFYHIWVTTPGAAEAVAKYADDRHYSKKKQGVNCSGLCSRALAAGGKAHSPDHPFNRVTYHGWGWDVVHALDAHEAGWPHMVLWVPNGDYARRVFNGDHAVVNYGHEK